ncbi:adenosylcobinamide-GDP ribazoletransferase [Kibdelosporangium banguiense]|uniref:Adenosylcobinamide-GDP ribazoletransferase n=1 Tax=Kibdelosporangium banguiense TaxID=1365924 RepID=A0ABS4U3C7_9PSEU|nr:adenosylcobinamide-GDP ribazoletransferase [Kibdelosporangium banguiense]MBP2331161.1 adenosylcobinamide-GDP ribazoletransferase [Kibdelosporangium banguiense]
MRLALSWLTVLPIGSGQVDRRTASNAIALAPLVGLLLGLAAAGLLQGAHGLLGGFLCVGLMALATRGMHLDGLADTADGLGCYGPPERALAVMKDGGVGAFAVVALIVVLGLQAVSIGSVHWGAVVLAFVVGRAAFSWCCRSGVPAARPDGLGALVASTQPVYVPAGWFFFLVFAAVPVVPGKLWAGPVSVIVAAVVLMLFTWHIRRRLGGVTGDVLGAACELTTTVVLVVCAMAG